MSKQPHIIGRTVLELNTGRLAEVWSLQEEMSRLIQKKAVPEMERLFDRLVGEDEVVRLDRVVVELEMSNSQFFADEFMHHLLKELNQALSDRLTGHSPISARGETITQNRAGADWEVLLYFLQYGRLPWWVSTMDWQVWIPRWEGVLQSDITWQVPLRNLIATKGAARQRLIAQFPEGFRNQIVLQLQPTWIVWCRLLVQARQVMQALKLRSDIARRLETQAWSLLLIEIGSASTAGQAFPVTQWIQTWLSQLVQTWLMEASSPLQSPLNSSNLGAFGERLQITPSTSGSSSVGGAEVKGIAPIRKTPQQKARQRLRTILKSYPAGERELWLAAVDRVLPAPTTKKARPKQDAADPDWRTIESSNTLEEQISLENRENQISSHAAMPTSNLTPTDLLHFPSTEAGDDSRPNAALFEANPQGVTLPQQLSNSSLSPEEEAAGIYVTQAGLVLLHPFLRIYFDHVGLIEGNAFRDEATQQTAIYLLYYLATRQTTAPEYELVLPKLLCGWSLNGPVIQDLELPETALVEGEHLLETVIKYWEVLKSTSPDGLRQGFLQRNGKLTRIDSGWKLQVEQQSIDILLGRLPWGVSMVTLPWMDGLLSVEWT